MTWADLTWFLIGGAVSWLVLRFAGLVWVLVGGGLISVYWAVTASSVAWGIVAVFVAAVFMAGALWMAET